MKILTLTAISTIAPNVLHSMPITVNFDNVSCFYDKTENYYVDGKPITGDFCFIEMFGKTYRVKQLHNEILRMLKS